MEALTSASQNIANNIDDRFTLRNNPENLLCGSFGPHSGAAEDNAIAVPEAILRS